MQPIAPSVRMMSVAAAVFGTTVISALQPPPKPRFIYKLGNSLYVPLTSRCNSLTLPQLRGESFDLPTSVVAALYRMRDAELHNIHGYVEEEEQTKWYLDGDRSEDLPPKMKLPPPPFETVVSLPPLASKSREREPRLDDLLQEIKHEFRHDNIKGESRISSEQSIQSIVISGEGEPTLRLEDTIELVQRIKSFTNSLPATSEQSPPSIRLTTNGLVVRRGALASSLPQTLCDSGVSNISVGLMTWNAKQYSDLVRPLLPHGEQETGFETMCSFIKDSVNVEGDLEVEATAVERPDVDKVRTEALAVSLGVTNPVRWRPYFP